MVKEGHKKGGAIKGFFFDLDGTLVDTHESNFRAYRQAIIEVVGVELGTKLKNYIKAGESSVRFLPRVIPSISDKQVEAINERKKAIYTNHLHVSQLNKYLSVFLKQISEHHVTVLVTTAKRQNATAVLKTHNLYRHFDFMIFGEDVKLMKPNPEAYILALQRANLSADDVIAFEDSEKGVEAAMAANIKTIHIRDFV